MMIEADNWFFAASILLTAFTVAVCARKCWTSSTQGPRLLLLVSLMYSIKIIAVTLYFNVKRLNAFTRYFLVYFFLNLPCLLLYYCYVERLCLLLDRNKAKNFRWIMFILLAIYGVLSVAVTTAYMMGARHTLEGKYVTSGPGQYETRVATYATDIVIASLIMIATSIATIRKIQGSDGVVGMNTKFYIVLFSSDAAKFLVVFLIDIYKAVTSFDPNAQAGILPSGNLGFQHFIDTLKICLMVFSLIIPAIIKSNDGTTAAALKKLSRTAFIDLQKSENIRNGSLKVSRGGSNSIRAMSGGVESSISSWPDQGCDTSTNNTEAKDVVGKTLSPNRSLSTTRPASTMMRQRESSLTSQRRISERQITPEYAIPIDNDSQL